MNPWDIVSWIGAIAVGLLIIALSVTMLTSLVRGPQKREDQFDRLARRLGKE
ncbi:hypothetical protein [Ruicaihuangia caeni]|uniref:Uncharacterized protein n=1 Tax=Ruicaihuangia caeni TaxID=3042517 RepID=A0AAW6TA19_9MICO|nr:hypothetical protein [Klugiella sp. YN-L-19]MDI2097997.1 hypothetical protein [Klugiella sp. YN-L-19]